MIRLHYFPGNASMTPHLLLRELDLPFELIKVDRNVGDHKSPDYLKLNPNGLIPVLEDGELVLYETPAILLHLVDNHAEAGLAPALGTPARAEFYKWLMWLSSSLQSMMQHYFYAERMVAPGNSVAAAEVRAAAEARIAAAIDQIETRLTATGGGMAGPGFSALDPYTFMLCRWTRGMLRPARTLPQIGRFLADMLERPATRSTLDAEGLTAPYV